MIGIINYGLGNIKAFANIFKAQNVAYKIIADKAGLAEVDKIILPGVGASDHAIKLLNDSGMRDELDKKVLDEKTPVLGVCVGMQLMAKTSEEGVLPMLNWVDAAVKKFNPIEHQKDYFLPHMGWNEMIFEGEKKLFSGLGNQSQFYFLHSYFIECSNPENVLATADYGGKFTCAIRSGNIYGVQFHPEKSHQNGIQLLTNFSKI